MGFDIPVILYNIYDITFLIICFKDKGVVVILVCRIFDCCIDSNGFQPKPVRFNRIFRTNDHQ